MERGRRQLEAKETEENDWISTIVVNCTGLGARELFGDRELMPIKGQLTALLPQPEIDYAIASEGLYMFPRREGIKLGGTFERGVETPEPNREVRTEDPGRSPADL